MNTRPLLLKGSTHLCFFRCSILFGLDLYLHAERTERRLESL